MNTVEPSSTVKTGSSLAAADASMRRAAETLEQLLAADDLMAALKQGADRFDNNLVALVRLNAETARTGGDAALAESLMIWPSIFFGRWRLSRPPLPRRPSRPSTTRSPAPRWRARCPKQHAGFWMWAVEPGF